MKVYHITNLHENTLTESHKYKIKHILLEIKSLKPNLIKNKACQSAISWIQHWWFNHCHSLCAIHVTDVFSIWPFQSPIFFFYIWWSILIRYLYYLLNIMLYCLCCLTCNDLFPAPGSNAVIFYHLNCTTKCHIYSCAFWTHYWMVVIGIIRLAECGVVVTKIHWNQIGGGRYTVFAAIVYAHTSQ